MLAFPLLKDLRPLAKPLKSRVMTPCSFCYPTVRSDLSADAQPLWGFSWPTITSHRPDETKGVQHPGGSISDGAS
jgi:hypothetical protein